MSHDHDHDHDHDPIGHDDEPAVATRVRELESVLVEKGVITREDLRKRIDWLVSTRSRRRRSARRASLGRSGVQAATAGGRTRGGARASASTPGRPRSSSRSRTPRTYTTWSSARFARATPRRCSGPPPDWYKSLPYRSRAVSDPRGVLREFGVELPADVEVRVVDSTADIRYLVIPRRPAGSEEMAEGELVPLITRDSMIGVALVDEP